MQDAVRKELDGSGTLLGYRAMQNRLRQEHDLLVQRDVEHAVMFDLDEEGLAARCLIRKKGKPKGHLTTRDVNWVCSLNGHEKLMGYRNSTFPLAVYGCIDTASRKLHWLRVWGEIELSSTFDREAHAHQRSLMNLTYMSFRSGTCLILVQDGPSCLWCKVL